MKTPTFTIEYPFELRHNPHLESLEKQVSTWIDDYKCLPESLKKRYRKSNFGKFTTSFFPAANAEQSTIIGRWILAAFAFDDLYGSNSLENLRLQCQKVIDIFEGKATEFENEIFEAFGTVRKEILSAVTENWMKRFVAHHQFWFEGMEEETIYSYNDKVSYPSLEEYKIIREKVSGGRTLCDFLEVISGFIMPDEIFSHPAIFRIRQLVTLMLSWFNDIHSVPWELERGEATNLVLVIKNENSCTMEEAYDKAIEIHDDDLAEFIRIKENLPDFGRYNEQIRKYIDHAELLLKGQEIWYFGGTERYTSAEK